MNKIQQKIKFYLNTLTNKMIKENKFKQIRNYQPNKYN